MSIDSFDIPLLNYAIVEDGCKLFGIVSWFGYFSVFCFKAIQLDISKKLADGHKWTKSSHSVKSGQ